MAAHNGGKGNFAAASKRNVPTEVGAADLHASGIRIFAVSIVTASLDKHS
ncbi:MAG: hypothetical protein QNL70_03150 [Pseudomonas sp.]